jgi:hypothetical protein
MPLNLPPGSAVLMPATDSADRAAGVDEKVWHAKLVLGCAFLAECLACLLHRVTGERFGLPLRNGHQERTFADEANRKRTGLDLNSTIVPAHVQWRPWLDPRFASYLTRDRQPPGSINGRSHTMKFTIDAGIWTYHV